MCTVEEAQALRLDAMGKEIETLHKCLAADQHLAFCHNDLQYGNIMIDEDTRSITIIVRTSSTIFITFYYLNKQTLF